MANPTPLSVAISEAIYPASVDAIPAFQSLEKMFGDRIRLSSSQIEVTDRHGKRLYFAQAEPCYGSSRLLTIGMLDWARKNRPTSEIVEAWRGLQHELTA